MDGACWRCMRKLHSTHFPLDIDGLDKNEKHCTGKRSHCAYPIYHPARFSKKNMNFMHKFCYAIGICLLLLGQSAMAGELVEDSFTSRALGREYKMRVYLPDGYKDQGSAPLPVIYLLHGNGGDETWWTDQDQGAAVATLDALIARGQMRPAIAVMPGNGKNWYVDGPVEKAESAIMEELLPYIEARYRVSKERSARIVGGLSMGGYGALNLALKHADKFCAAMIMSPASYDPLPPAASAARSFAGFMRNGQFDAGLWKSMNYPAHLAAYQKQKQKVSFWIVSGDHDYLGIALLSAQLYARLLPIQAKQVELRIVDGDHEAMVWRDALPDALRYADEQCVKSR